MSSIPEEKLEILKRVPLFADTPDDVLKDMVPLLEEVTFQAGETIFFKGDFGSSLYIIVDGTVRVHDDEMTLNFLHAGAVFGEMAAIDPEPRSASVTAEDTIRLFRLEQEPLYRLMEHHIEVVRGIIHVLCQHLRARMRDLREDFTYLQQVAQITAAAVAVESGIFDPDSLNEVAGRSDELGQLARVFQRMTREVYAREQRLKREVQELRIEVDNIKAEHQVAEITGTDYFRELQREAKKLRRQTGES